MPDPPNYPSYTIEELRDALAHVDREQYPERVELILEEIKKRKAEQASSQDRTAQSKGTGRKGMRVVFKNQDAKINLIVIFSVLMVFHLINLLFGSLFSIIAIVVQGCIIILILKHDPFLITMIKTWAGILIAIAMLGILSGSITLITAPADHPFTIGLGLIIFYGVNFLLGVFLFRSISKNLSLEPIRQNQEAVRSTHV